MPFFPTGTQIMRLQIRLKLEHETAVSLNSQHLLTAVVYRFLEYSNADYARFLHREGYAPGENDTRRFKLFCFSPIRSQKSFNDLRDASEVVL